MDQCDDVSLWIQTYVFVHLISGCCVAFRRSGDTKRHKMAAESLAVYFLFCPPGAAVVKVKMRTVKCRRASSLFLTSVMMSAAVAPPSAEKAPPPEQRPARLCSVH